MQFFDNDFFNPLIFIIDLIIYDDLIELITFFYEDKNVKNIIFNIKV